MATKNSNGPDSGPKMDPSDYDALISQHSVYESGKIQHKQQQQQQQQQHQQQDALASFSGYANAGTQTGQPVQSNQTEANLPSWHYNPWWMLASTSSVPNNQNGNGADANNGNVPDPDSQEGSVKVKTEAPASPSDEGVCDECSDPYCDSSSGVCRKLFHCPHCRKSYPTVLEFNTHLSGVHPAQRPFRCQICLEPFDRKGHLLRHLDANHTRKDMNKCTVCSKYIKDKSNLRKHMQVHTGRVPQKQFKCDLCNNKRYMSLDRLNNHRVVCTGEKVLKYCDMCSKVFDNTRSLNSHRKVHAKELKCDMCGEQFRTLEHLTNHKRSSCKFASVAAAAATAVATTVINCRPNCERDDAYGYVNERAPPRVIDAALSALKPHLN